MNVSPVCVYKVQSGKILLCGQARHQGKFTELRIDHLRGNLHDCSIK